MSKEPRPFLSVAELGERLGVSKRTAYKYASEGIVPVIRIRGVLRVPAAALETWIAEREQEALDAVRNTHRPPPPPLGPEREVIRG